MQTSHNRRGLGQIVPCEERWHQVKKYRGEVATLLCAWFIFSSRGSEDRAEDLNISRQKNGTAEDCRPRIAQKHSGEKQQIAPRASALLWKLTKMPLKNASYQNAPRGMDNKKILRKYGIKKMLQNIFRARSKGSAPLGELFFSLESALRPARCRIRWFWGVQLASGALHFKTLNKK